MKNVPEEDPTLFYVGATGLEFLTDWQEGHIVVPTRIRHLHPQRKAFVRAGVGEPRAEGAGTGLGTHLPVGGDSGVWAS